MKEGKSMLTRKFILLLVLYTIFATINISKVSANSEPKYLITNDSSFKINNETWPEAPGPGDTIFVSFDRTEFLWFDQLIGDKDNPITVINYGGQVNINTDSRFAIKFTDCKHIKISGAGDPNTIYGFKLGSIATGLEFGSLSSDCEAEFIEIDHEGFFGILAKKDFGGNPPTPAPVFDGLKIHDCFIKNVTEGMYLGETISPGMEFKHVEIYNNIVYNTGREAIQIANMVEDVKIFNNTLVSGGNDGESYQGNLLQIGDNSVAEVYNNILIGANQYGITCFGNGDNKFYNNYISDCKGIFLDNRNYSTPESIIEMYGNYFHNITGKEVIKNYNEVNPLDIQYNVYDTKITFLNNTSKSIAKVDKNILKRLKEVSLKDIENDNFTKTEDSEAEYKDLGAYPQNGFIKNQTNYENEPSISIADLFPNPVSDELNVKMLNNFLGVIDIKIFNIGGKQLLQTSFNSNFSNIESIDLSSIQEVGILFVRIQSEFGNSQVLKILKIE